MNPFNKNKDKLKILTPTTQKKITVSKNLFKENTSYFKLPTYKKNNKETSINYLDEYIEKDFKDIYKKTNKASVCLYNIHFIKDSPFLSYIFEKKNIDSQTLLTFPVFNIENILNIDSFIDLLNSYLKFKTINFKGYIENNDNLFLFFEYNDILDITSKNFVSLTIHEICLTKKYYNSNIHESAYTLFFENPFLMQLRNKHDIPYPTPIVCYYKNDFNKVSNYFGPLKLKNSYYDFYCYDSDFSHFKQKNISFEKNLTRIILFLLDTKYIFTNNDEINIEGLLNYYSSLFIGKNVYTEKTLDNPESRIVLKNTSDFIIFK